MKYSKVLSFLPFLHNVRAAVSSDQIFGYDASNSLYISRLKAKINSPNEYIGGSLVGDDRCDDPELLREDDSFDFNALSNINMQNDEALKPKSIHFSRADDLPYNTQSAHLNREFLGEGGGASIKKRYLKTGTTIVGLKTKDHVIIAADSRATEGTIVADTRCEKVHQLSSNIWCCGAGTSADLDALTRKIRYSFLLKGRVKESIGNRNFADVQDHLNTEEEIDINQTFAKASISSVCHMIREELYKGGGDIGANLVLGGIDQYTNQPMLTAIHPHGSIDMVPYTALGSGSLAAMGYLESRYRIEMELEEAVTLVQDAVLAGIRNDLGSGSQIDVCIISRSCVTYKRGSVKDERLKLSRGDKEIDSKLSERHSVAIKYKSVGGVNGFGSLSYQISPKKIVMLDEVENDWLLDM